MDDATVLQRIKSDALRDVGLSPSDIEVGVHDGIATLEGTVETSQLAEREGSRRAPRLERRR
jgi:osmotically-inducible protein OsmY